VLRTRRVGQDAAAGLESLDPSSLASVEVEGHALGRVLVRERFVPVLADVFDRLALRQTPLEQVVYGHLYRLSVGQERNWCRVSRAELSKRTSLSDRRLMKALAGLAAHGHIALVSRDRQGTLYRVYLPHEALGEAAADTVVMPRQRVKPADKPTPRPADKPTPAPPDNKRAGRASPRPKAPQAGPELSVGAVAAGFLAKHPERPGRTRADVVDEILGRLEEGRTFDEIVVELERFAQHAPRTTPIAEIGPWLERNQ
jgi:hypothetical protein